MSTEELKENLLPTGEEILMNEDSILRGMLEAANFRQDTSNHRKVQIKRNDKVLFEFVVRPLSEEEIFECRRKATKYYNNPAGRHLPKVEGDTDISAIRAYKIVAATVDSDKIWNNPTIKNSLNVLRAVDVVEEILMAGEKDRINDIIDEISGYGNSEVTREEYVKN